MGGGDEGNTSTYHRLDLEGTNINRWRALLSSIIVARRLQFSCFFSFSCSQFEKESVRGSRSNKTVETLINLFLNASDSMKFDHLIRAWALEYIIIANEAELKIIMYTNYCLLCRSPVIRRIVVPLQTSYCICCINLTHILTGLHYKLANECWWRLELFVVH